MRRHQRCARVAAKRSDFTSSSSSSSAAAAASNQPHNTLVMDSDVKYMDSDVKYINQEFSPLFKTRSYVLYAGANFPT